MKFRNMSPAAARPGDSPKMAEALDRLLLAGIDACRPAGSDHQIKVACDVSYYPDKGTILPDGGRALAAKGLDALIDYLRETGRTRD